MIYDLIASHPSLAAAAPSVLEPRALSPILDYPSFLKQQQQQQQQRNHVVNSEPVYTPSYSSSHVGNYLSDLGPSTYQEAVRLPRNQQPQHQQHELKCVDVQRHVAGCSVCRNYILWQQWHEISHWIVIGLVIIYFFRTNQSTSSRS